MFENFQNLFCDALLICSFSQRLFFFAVMDEACIKVTVYQEVPEIHWFCRALSLSTSLNRMSPHYGRGQLVS